MKKTLYFLLLISMSACGQTTPTEIKVNIQNSKTAKHINIPGTRLYIIPPPDFKLSSTFIGFQKGDYSMMNAYDIIGGNINTNAATFNKEEFEKKGIKVFSFKEITVDGYPGKFIHMQGDATAKGYAIVFGDTTFTTMIMTAYPVTDDKTGNDIVNSLNTIYYDKNKKINPFETANFSLDDRKSKFKFFQYNASLYIYLVNGVENKEDKEAPAVIVLQLPKDETMTVKSVADMMISKLQEKGLTDPEIQKTSTEKINGYDTYQEEVKGKSQGKNCLFYYCVVTKGNKIIVIQGVAKNDFENNLQEFKKLAATIQVK